MTEQLIRTENSIKFKNTAIYEPDTFFGGTGQCGCFSVHSKSSKLTLALKMGYDFCTQIKGLTGREYDLGIISILATVTFLSNLKFCFAVHRYLSIGCLQSPYLSWPCD